MIHEFTLNMKSFNKRARTIRIYLPDDYELVNKSYPVIYMHDGQNLYEDSKATYGKSWNIPDQFKERSMDFIVVGIDSGEGLTRMDELSPWLNEDIIHDKDLQISRPCGGEGDRYLEFITEELKPLIDSKYRTKSDRAHTCIAGSSMGGLISFYSVLKRPDIFSKACCLSTSFWFDEIHILEIIKSIKEDDIKIYFSFGTNEALNKEMNDYLIDFNKVVLYKIREKGIDSQFHLHEQGQHNEASWEHVFPLAVGWVFDNENY